MSSFTEIKIRGYHIDFYGHVNNARYLEFLEEARWNVYEDYITSTFFKKSGLNFIVVNININYRAAATLNQILTIETLVKKIGTKSVTLLQKILVRDSNILVVDAEVTFVITDKTGKALPVEGDLKDMLNID